jgi:hypothetical protein
MPSDDGLKDANRDRIEHYRGIVDRQDQMPKNSHSTDGNVGRHYRQEDWNTT